MERTAAWVFLAIFLFGTTKKRECLYYPQCSEWIFSSSKKLEGQNSFDLCRTAQAVFEDIFFDNVHDILSSENLPYNNNGWLLFKHSPKHPSETKIQ